MATAKISELTNPTLPLDVDSLFEVSEPTVTPPYTSRKVPLLDLFGAYRREVPTTGGTVVLTANDRLLILDPATNLATLTVTLATGVDRARVKICTRETIDALTINGGTNDWTAANQLPANAAIELLYIVAITTWVRIG